MSSVQKPRKRLWPFMGLLAVTGMWGVSACANGWAGWSLSDEPTISFILACASIASDVMKAVSLFVVVAAIANRRWTAVVAGLMVFVLCACWSLRSATYFASSMLTQHVAERSFKKSLQNSRMDLFETDKLRLKYLSQQDLSVDANNKGARVDVVAERRRIAEEYAKVRDEIQSESLVLAGTRVIANGDPLAAILNLDDATVVLWTALSFAVLLEFVSGVGFWMIAHSRLERQSAASTPAPMRTPSVGAKGGNGATNVVLLKKKARGPGSQALIDALALGPCSNKELARRMQVRVSTAVERVNRAQGVTRTRRGKETIIALQN